VFGVNARTQVSVGTGGDDPHAGPEGGNTHGGGSGQVPVTKKKELRRHALEKT